MQKHLKNIKVISRSYSAS